MWRPAPAPPAAAPPPRSSVCAASSGRDAVATHRAPPQLAASPRGDGVPRRAQSARAASGASSGLRDAFFFGEFDSQRQLCSSWQSTDTTFFAAGPPVLAGQPQTSPRAVASPRATSARVPANAGRPPAGMSLRPGASQAWRQQWAPAPPPHRPPPRRRGSARHTSHHRPPPYLEQPHPPMHVRTGPPLGMSAPPPHRCAPAWTASRPPVQFVAAVTSSRQNVSYKPTPDVYAGGVFHQYDPSARLSILRAQLDALLM